MTLEYEVLSLLFLIAGSASESDFSDTSEFDTRKLANERLNLASLATNFSVGNRLLPGK